jgi:anti-anti-sigma factor
MPMQMKILPSVKDVTYIALMGRFDTVSVPDIEGDFQAYIESRMKPTIVDLSEVTLLPSAGMRMLLNASRALRSAGAKLVLLKPSRLIADALRTAHLDAIFPIVDNEPQALKIAMGMT